jgi:L-aminopeptidase/D-esterase-like protein
MAFDGTKIIMGAISIVIGLVLLPLMAGFTNSAKNDTNVSAVSGLTAVIDLILYGFTFGLVGLGIGLIYIGFKGGK